MKLRRHILDAISIYKVFGDIDIEVQNLTEDGEFEVFTDFFTVPEEYDDGMHVVIRGNRECVESLLG